MTEKRSTSKKDKQVGQGLVEFALILPVLLLLMWGIIEFGRMLVMYTEVSNAAREAIRYSVARGMPGEETPLSRLQRHRQPRQRHDDPGPSGQLQFPDRL